MILIGGLSDEKNQQMLASAKADVYYASLLIGFAGMFFGYLVARISTLPPRDARTVSFETGIQNVAMTVSVIAFAYGPLGYSEDVDKNTFDPCKMNDLEGLPHVCCQHLPPPRISSSRRPTAALLPSRHRPFPHSPSTT